MNLYEKFLQFIQQRRLFNQQDHLLLAVSGGIDSVVLCDLCYKAGYKFSIAHANFQLRGGDSERDEQFVKAIAQKYAVDFFVKKFDTVAYAAENKKSIEETARILRYAWFNELIGKQATATENHSPVLILTAHHADDNIETVCMNFFRGTGIRGLRGILPVQHQLIRPLLFATKPELEAYATDNQLDFVTDHTNAENEYTRNFFRNEIIPLVVQRYPEARFNVLKNIERFGEVEILYQQALELHLKKLVVKKGNEMHIPVLKLLKTIPLSTVVFEIITAYGFSAHQTEEVIALLNSETGKYVQSATHRIIKNRNWLIISPNQTQSAQHILVDESVKEIEFDLGQISFTTIAMDGYLLEKSGHIAQLDAALITYPLLLRKWKPGDYFYPLGMHKKKKVGRFYSDEKLSLVEKENAWVIEMDRKIVWLAGMRIDNRFKVNPNTKAILKMVFTKKMAGE